jgi:enoyl-CoA hydratase/carnithine racemase
MQLDEIIYQVDGNVAIVTLDRPEVLNAISGREGGMRDQILHAVGTAEGDPAVGCVVLRGNGRAFCGGGDLTGNARRETLEEHHAFLERANRFHCLGAGLLLAAACDLVVAGRSATFGFPEGRLGLIGASVLAPRIGRQWAKFLTLTGESISADRAGEIGLVLAIEPDDELQERVVDLARRVARMPREGVLLNRQSIDAVADAAGDAAARAVAVDRDAATLDAADRATAPDGRTFRSILDAEGIEGLKRARAAQYDTNWLRPDAP